MALTGVIWRTFQTDVPGEPARKYVIRCLSSNEDVEACVRLMTTDFLPDEPLCTALRTTSDAVSVASIQDNWRRLLSQGLGLGCFSADDELVAANVCIVHSRGDPEEDPSEVAGASWRAVLRALVATEATCDVFRYFGVESYLTCSGLVVARSHRGRHIGLHMLEARERLCSALGLRATASVFTASSSQALAARCGWRVLGELSYARLRLPPCTTPSAKLMGTAYTC